MSDYISRDAVRLIESNSTVYSEAWNASYEQGFCDGINAVLELPAADVVEVVRCRECKYFLPEWPDDASSVYQCHKGLGWPGPDGYCYKGERKDGADNG